MEKLFLAIIVIMCVGGAVLLVGCQQNQTLSSSEEVITGGKEDHSDYDAPKEIKSEEMISFETNFFRYGDYVYEKDRSYRFKMTKSEDDIFIITEGYDEKLKCETDGTFPAKLQQVIREYNLVSLNGISKQTYGLPEEFAPCFLSAEYASGEKLYFYMDNDPEAEWSGAILDLFSGEFGNHGIDDLLPPKEESMMTRFSLEYSFGDVRYCYGEILVPVTEEEKSRSFEEILTEGRNEDDCVKKAYAEVWDRSGTELSDNRSADTTEEHYLALQEIVEETELIRFQNGQIIPGEFDYDNAQQYYEFYIEYESGKRMSGFSDDAKLCEKFKPIAERFSRYYEEYLENNKD